MNSSLENSVKTAASATQSLLSSIVDNLDYNSNYTLADFNQAEADIDKANSSGSTALSKIADNTNFAQADFNETQASLESISNNANENVKSVANSVSASLSKLSASVKTISDNANGLTKSSFNQLSSNLSMISSYALADFNQTQASLSGVADNASYAQADFNQAEADISKRTSSVASLSSRVLDNSNNAKADFNQAEADISKGTSSVASLSSQIFDNSNNAKADFNQAEADVNSLSSSLSADNSAGTGINYDQFTNLADNGNFNHTLANNHILTSFLAAKYPSSAGTIAYSLSSLANISSLASNASFATSLGRNTNLLSAFYKGGNRNKNWYDFIGAIATTYQFQQALINNHGAKWYPVGNSLSSQSNAINSLADNMSSPVSPNASTPNSLVNNKVFVENLGKKLVKNTDFYQGLATTEQFQQAMLNVNPWAPLADEINSLKAKVNSLANK